MEHDDSGGVVGKEKQHVAGAIAFDARGHGASSKASNNDFSLEILTADCVKIVKACLDRFFSANASQDTKSSPKTPQLILVGHSLGGAVLTNTALLKQLPNVVGLAVLDVVEGSALEALQSMGSILRSRPQTFSTLQQGIDWHFQSHVIRNRESARISVPGLLHQDSNDSRWTWTTDLSKTEPYWREWFTGLSEKFIKTPTARLLILAGTDRLDKQLMIGQMQGKYQLVVFQEAGHFLHEDCPDKTALTVSS